jgi:hypothetical protein
MNSTLSPARKFNTDGSFAWPYWRALPEWTVDEALALLHDAPAILRIRHRSIADSVLLHIGKDTRELFLRSLGQTAAPSAWVALAEKLEIRVPAQLR